MANPVRFGNLVAWYPFRQGTAQDETAGDSSSGDSTDYSGNINGATHSTSGGVNDIDTGLDSGKFSFNGSGDDISGVRSLAGSSGFTICIWAKFDTFSQNQTFYSDYDLNTPRPMNTYWNSSKGEAYIHLTDSNGNEQFNLAGYDIRQDINTNEWVHLAWSWSSSTDTVKFYLNGNQKSTDTFVESNIQPTPANSQNIGALNGSNGSFDGDYDDVRVYEPGISGSDINQIYQNTKPNQPFSASFSSLSSSSQTSTSIDVSADLDSISSSSSSVDLGFEFRESSNSTYQSQVTQTVDPSKISTPFNFSDTISSLTSNTDHDIRAFADDGTNRVTSSNINVTTKTSQKPRLFGGLSSFATSSDNRLFGDLKTFQSDGIVWSIGVDQIKSDSARLKLFIDDIQNANKGRLFELYIDQNERRSFYTNLETEFKPIVGNLSPNTTFNYRVEEYKNNAFIKEKSLQFTTLPTQDLDVNVQFRFKAKFSGQQRSSFERNQIAFLEALKDGVNNDLDIDSGAIVDGSGNDLHTSTIKINNDNNKVKTEFAVLPTDLATNSNPQRYVIRDSNGNDIWSADISTEMNTDTRQTILVTFISQ
jgi:hypothetical protein